MCVTMCLGYVHYYLESLEIIIIEMRISADNSLKLLIGV